MHDQVERSTSEQVHHQRVGVDLDVQVVDRVVVRQRPGEAQQAGQHAHDPTPGGGEPAEDRQVRSGEPTGLEPDETGQLRELRRADPGEPVAQQGVAAPPVVGAAAVAAVDGQQRGRVGEHLTVRVRELVAGGDVEDDVDAGHGRP